MTENKKDAMSDVNERPQQTATPLDAITADLVAVLVAVTDGYPKIMTIDHAQALPSGPFQFAHRSLQMGLWAWVEAQTGHPLGYVEQLYTFADRGRTGDPDAPHRISISYLGLTREEGGREGTDAQWSSWYDYFPWEDHRDGSPDMLAKIIMPRLKDWARAAEDPALQKARWRRAAISFGLDGREWNEELALQRYELLYEVALLPESVRDKGGSEPTLPGRAMVADHRRILATGIARLRAKIKYRPVVFELMPEQFTLLELQRSVEALAGRLVHKQNFRRLIEQQELVEETGTMAPDTIGRPAKLFRFRKGVLAERAVVGTKLPLSRS